MNTSILRRKRVVLPAVAAVGLLAVGGTFWAASADDVPPAERDRVSAAAVEAAGGGTAVEVETGDDRGEAYEVEVRRADGTEVDISLDRDLDVVGSDRDDDREDGPDADDRVLTATERRAAGRAALNAVGSGTVIDVEAGDERGVAYEVEVVDAAGVEWDVELAADFAVVDRRADR